MEGEDVALQIEGYGGSGYQPAESFGPLLQTDHDETSNEETRLQRRYNKLNQEVMQLEREINELKEIENKEERYTSASRDARKMYGDITPGDQTHQDVILLYQNHFKSAFRNMPKDLYPKDRPPEDKDKFEIWQMCGHIFQVCFDAMKDDIIATMKKGMDDSFKKDFNDSECKLDENTRDIFRAFKMIISQFNAEKVKQKVKEKIPLEQEEMFDFVWTMIQTLDPVDYASFIATGELQDRIQLLRRQ
ncbi:PREDICTED: uncharacterized protein LOC109581550 isoform X2 [Amphimedon queenslandica]|uniref:Uncharacterized protein n=1 Tax=Amphimedon queenslandica TaxID=400682 RepID=A0A1X7V083_AMPQE|nr:PREDICTED: uncharacterized protein LOC109581550 isoform X2 [Amphimedon queenslandica]|eukprot:XP_019851322.1 PREDICTED: uncharacterized protein LOC109581550 isoform X2 [Amphimedon queenslandica]